MGSPQGLTCSCMLLGCRAGWHFEVCVPDSLISRCQQVSNTPCLLAKIKEAIWQASEASTQHNACKEHTLCMWIVQENHGCHYFQLCVWGLLVQVAAEVLQELEVPYTTELDL